MRPGSNAALHAFPLMKCGVQDKHAYEVYTLSVREAHAPKDPDHPERQTSHKELSILLDHTVPLMKSGMMRHYASRNRCRLPRLPGNEVVKNL